MTMMKVSPERKDYYIRTLLDNLGRLSEENNMLIEEVVTLESEIKRLMTENSNLKHQVEKNSAVPQKKG